MSDEENDSVPMAECGACRTVIPLDSEQCPECDTRFSGVSEEALGECGACQQLVPLDSTRCPECGVVFVADDVVDILRTWVHTTGINIRKLFEKFDENSDGTIDSSELKTGLLGLNLADLPPSQVERLVAEIDADGNGVIDLDEFESILMGESDGGSDADGTDVSEAEESSNQEETALEYSENVLSQVMKSHGIDESEKEAFIAFAANHNADGNSYLKKEELKAAAQGWNAQDETVEEEAADEEIEESTEAIVDEVDEGEEYHDEMDSEESEDADIESTESDNESEEEVDDDESDESEHDDAGIEDEDFDLEDESSEPVVHPLQALADMMDELEISAQRMFNELDVDGNGLISLDELTKSLNEKYGDVLGDADIDSIMEGVDGDGDGMIDVTEFIGSMEELDDHEEAVEAHAPEKEFPTVWQKRMMSKTWNDSVWPILHVGFGLLIVLVLVNAMVGPVDGSGGNVVYEAMDNGILPPDEMKLIDGVTVYACDNEYQNGGCKNSLTPLAGEASSMPKGFYWDGILLMLLSISGMASSLFLHLIKAPAWRARAKAMKEFSEDKADAEEASSDDEGEEDEPEIDEGIEVDQEVEDDGDGELEDEESVEDVEEDEDDDTIDVGSHIGLMLEDEEVFGTILEFDDEEGTVTIEEDGTGDLVTGYQDDMFLE